MNVTNEIRYNGKRLIDLSKKTLITLIIGLYSENIQMQQWIENQNLSLIKKPDSKEINKILKLS